jgi:dipeptidyl aminopeptidase/acylaminoacyl peptidase
MAGYLVQSPNLQTNQNDIDLDVISVTSEQGGPRRLFIGTKVSELHWIEGGRAIAVLANWKGRVSVLGVEVPSGRVAVLARGTEDISEFSISDDGQTIVFAVEEQGTTAGIQPTSEEEARGYRIPFEKKSASTYPKRELFVTHKLVGKWSAPRRLSLRLPFMENVLEAFPYVVDLRLSLSPDGRSLAFTYVESSASLSDVWKQSPTVRTIEASVGIVAVTAVIDLKTNIASLPLASPWAYSVPFWSADSRSFIVSANSPVNSDWEREDVRQHRAVADAAHLFEVTPRTGAIHLIRSALHGVEEMPLSWTSDGDLLLRTADDVFAHMRLEGDRWKETSQVHISLRWRSRNTDIVSDGKVIVGDYETPATPPSFFVAMPGDHGFERLVNLNPQFERLTLAPTRDVQWDTSTGYHASGLLFLPPDYNPQKAYPLVIHSYPASSNFFCDSGGNHEPAFAPQPLANAGIMYLVRIPQDGQHRSDEQAHYPTGYPGLLAEAAFQTDVWDSAVDRLALDGLIDRTKVGIIGFSRSGWYTEFALTHGRTHYAAATVADNVEYSLGEYWMGHSDGTLKGWDAMFGGPPYGDTLRNWMRHSISFNIDKIHAPLLMEQMGNGLRFTDVKNPPSNLESAFEVFTGLSRLHRPVELYYYPFESHQPDDPLARLGSLERNLDWYEFWLKGVERSEVRDRGQYLRWRALRTASATKEQPSVDALP